MAGKSDRGSDVMGLNENGNMKKKISYGCGVGSTGLICHLYDNIDDYEILFVNHGGDYPETYEYFDYIKNALKIRITELKPNIEGFSDLYEYLHTKGLAPNRVRRFCTDKAKIRTIHRYCTDRPYSCALGITFDERHRAVKSSVSYEICQYPLVDARIDRRGAIQLIREMGLKIPRRSCCWFCFNASWKELDKLRRDYPDLYRARKELYLNEKLKKNLAVGQCQITALPS